MQLCLPSEVDVPAELIYEILRNLNQRSLKRVRLVCAELAALARPLLFKTISLSLFTDDVARFLNIVRDEELCRAVEEFVCNEVDISTPRQAEANPSRGIIICPRGHHLHAREMGDAYKNIFFCPRGHYSFADETGDAVSEDPGLDSSIDALLGRIRHEYEEQAAARKTGYDVEALVEGLLAMSNLRRIIVKDSRPPGISTDSAFEAPSLAALRAHFPASDATLGVFNTANSPPDHGFFIILRALAATGAKVDMLVTERIGLLKQGISLQGFSLSSPFHQEYILGFQHLRKISLCLDDEGWMIQEIGLSACILAATKMEHLELSLTHGVRERRCLALDWLLPSMPLRHMHTLVLEGFHATAEELTSFLVLQAPSLRHLTLWSMQLCAGRLWKDVLETLYLCEEFHLDSFTLKTPEDDEVRRHAEVPARVSDHDVLHFVNTGGRNPFANRDWRPEPSSDSDLDTASDVSDVSDCSVWRNQQAEDPEDIDYDLDGPEYNSDYDTDPDSDETYTDSEFDEMS